MVVVTLKVSRHRAVIRGHMSDVRVYKYAFLDFLQGAVWIQIQKVI